MVGKLSVACRGCALALSALLAMGLVACSQQEQSPNQHEGALYGSPWVTSVFAGNLPDAAPSAADDLYLHYAYDYAAAHQEAFLSARFYALKHRAHMIGYVHTALQNVIHRVVAARISLAGLFVSVAQGQRKIRNETFRYAEL